MTRASGFAGHRHVAVALYQQTWGSAAPRDYSYSPDRMVLGLATDGQVESLLVADPRRNVLGVLREGIAGAPLPGDPSSRRMIRPVRLWPTPPRDHLQTLRELRRLDRHLLRRVGRDDAVFVTCNPMMAAVADRHRWADVVYYGWDEWSSFGWASSGRHAYLRDSVLWAYGQMADRDVKVIGVSQAIVDRIHPRRGIVVPNGIVAADFEHLDVLPGWFAELPGRVALYAGSLEDRIDTDALEACADEIGDGWTLVLVGPMRAPERFRGLLARPNVVVHEELPRATVLSMMAASDVGLVCHRDTPLTRAMSPLKLYEYLASGLPVVATDLEPMRNVSSRCVLMPAGGSWAPAVVRAAELGPADPVSLSRFRARHDWTNRYREWREFALSPDL